MVIHASGSRGAITPFTLAVLAAGIAVFQALRARAARRLLPGHGGGELPTERVLVLGDRAALCGFLARVLALVTLVLLTAAIIAAAFPGRVLSGVIIAAILAPVALAVLGLVGRGGATGWIVDLLVPDAGTSRIASGQPRPQAYRWGWGRAGRLAGLRSALAQDRQANAAARAVLWARYAPAAGSVKLDIRVKGLHDELHARRAGWHITAGIAATSAALALLLLAMLPRGTLGAIPPLDGLHFLPPDNTTLPPPDDSEAEDETQPDEEPPPDEETPDQSAPDDPDSSNNPDDPDDQAGEDNGAECKNACVSDDTPSDEGQNEGDNTVEGDSDGEDGPSDSGQNDAGDSDGDRDAGSGADPDVEDSSDRGAGGTGANASATGDDGDGSGDARGGTGGSEAGDTGPDDAPPADQPGDARDQGKDDSGSSGMGSSPDASLNENPADVDENADSDGNPASDGTASSGRVSGSDSHGDPQGDEPATQSADGSGAGPDAGSDTDRPDDTGNEMTAETMPDSATASFSSVDDMPDGADTPGGTIEGDATLLQPVTIDPADDLSAPAIGETSPDEGQPVDHAGTAFDLPTEGAAESGRPVMVPASDPPEEAERDAVEIGTAATLFAAEGMVPDAVEWVLAPDEQHPLPPPGLRSPARQPIPAWIEALLP